MLAHVEASQGRKRRTLSPCCWARSVCGGFDADWQAKGEGKASRRRPAASGAGRRPVRSGKVEKDSCGADKSSSTRNQSKSNSKMREMFEEQTRRRNEFLSQRCDGSEQLRGLEAKLGLREKWSVLFLFSGYLD